MVHRETEFSIFGEQGNRPCISPPPPPLCGPRLNDQWHARIQEFLSGMEVGGSRPNGENTALKTLLFVCFFLVLNLFYSSQREFSGFITEKTTFSRNQRGSNIFGGGGGEGSKCFFYRIPICDFPGVRVRTPSPPLVPHTNGINN